VLGGLLSEKYLGRAEPGRADLNTASLRKYMQMIDVWGGWTLFQELLAVLAQIAGKYRVGLAAIAIRSILDRAAVAGAIVGTRLGVAEHITENARVFDVVLDAEDEAALAPVLAKGRDLMMAIGDCGDEYR